MAVIRRSPVWPCPYASLWRIPTAYAFSSIGRLGFEKPACLASHFSFSLLCHSPHQSSGTIIRWLGYLLHKPSSVISDIGLLINVPDDGCQNRQSPQTPRTATRCSGRSFIACISFYSWFSFHMRSTCTTQCGRSTCVVGGVSGPTTTCPGFLICNRKESLPRSTYRSTSPYRGGVDMWNAPVYS